MRENAEKKKSSDSEIQVKLEEIDCDDEIKVKLELINNFDDDQFKVKLEEIDFDEETAQVKLEEIEYCDDGKVKLEEVEWNQGIDWSFIFCTNTNTYFGDMLLWARNKNEYAQRDISWQDIC